MIRVKNVLILGIQIQTPGKVLLHNTASSVQHPVISAAVCCICLTWLNKHISGSAGLALRGIQTVSNSLVHPAVACVCVYVCVRYPTCLCEGRFSCFCCSSHTCLLSHSVNSHVTTGHQSYAPPAPPNFIFHTHSLSQESDRISGGLNLSLSPSSAKSHTNHWSTKKISSFTNSHTGQFKINTHTERIILWARNVHVYIQDYMKQHFWIWPSGQAHLNLIIHGMIFFPPLEIGLLWEIC